MYIRPVFKVYSPLTRFIKTFKVYVLQKIIMVWQKFYGWPSLGSVYRDKKKTRSRYDFRAYGIYRFNRICIVIVILFGLYF